jgi:hypothetical protein
MIDHITKKVRDTVRKGVIPKKMKIVIVLGTEPEKQYIVQSEYFAQRKIKRPGKRIMLETEYAAAARLIELAVGMVPLPHEIFIMDSAGSGTNQVSYVFWFAPPNFSMSLCPQLDGYVHALRDQSVHDETFVQQAEARIATDLLMRAAALRTVAATHPS